MIIIDSAFCTFLFSMCPAVFHPVSMLLPKDFANSELPLALLLFLDTEFNVFNYNSTYMVYIYDYIYYNYNDHILRPRNFTFKLYLISSIFLFLFGKPRELEIS